MYRHPAEFQARSEFTLRADAPLATVYSKLYDLRRGRTGDHERPHKPALLLALIDLVDSGRFIPFTPSEDAQLAAEAPAPYGAKKPVSQNAIPFAPFELCFFDDPFQMEDALRQRLAEGKTARLLASYSREWKTGDVASPHNVPPSLMDFHEPIVTNGQTRHWSRVWNYVPANGSDYTHYIQGRPGSRIHADPLCEVGCPYAVCGFDFDYVGILWMSDLVWRDGRWQVNPQHIHETGTKRLLSAARKGKVASRSRPSSPSPLRPSRLPHPSNSSNQGPVPVVRGSRNENEISQKSLEHSIAFLTLE